MLWEWEKMKADVKKNYATSSLLWCLYNPHTPASSNAYPLFNPPAPRTTSSLVVLSSPPILPPRPLMSAPIRSCPFVIFTFLSLFFQAPKCTLRLCLFVCLIYRNVLPSAFAPGLQACVAWIHFSPFPPRWLVVDAQSHRSGRPVHVPARTSPLPSTLQSFCS